MSDIVNRLRGRVATYLEQKAADHIEAQDSEIAELRAELALLRNAATVNAVQNQCDGCVRGMIIEKGFHRDANGHAYMACQSYRYQPTAKIAAMPEGWVMVPINPTQRMLNAARWLPSGHAVTAETALFVWSSMVNSATEQEVK